MVLLTVIPLKYDEKEKVHIFYLDVINGAVLKY